MSKAVGRTDSLGDCVCKLGCELVAVVGAVKCDKLCNPCGGFHLEAQMPNREQRGRLVLARYCLVPTANSMAVPTEGFKTRPHANGLHR